MRIHSKLCHIETNRSVVLATGWDSDKSLGSALGEARSTEEAEERAINRLLRRLNKVDKIDSTQSGSQLNNQNHSVETNRPGILKYKENNRGKKNKKKQIK